MARIVTEAGPKISPKVSPKPASRSRVGWYVLAILCLVQFGMIGGWAAAHYWEFDPFGLHVAPGPVAKKDDSDTAEDLKPTETPTAARGDTLLREGATISL